MVAEIYDALIAAGSPEDKARKAAEAVADYEAYEPRFIKIETSISNLERDLTEVKRDIGVLREDISGLKRDVFLLKWMMGFVLAFQVAMFFKLFLH